MLKNTTMPFYSSYTCYHVANKIPNFQILITTNLVLSQTKNIINIILFSVSMTLIVKILGELAYLGILARSNEVIFTKALWRKIKAVYQCKVSGISNACHRLNIHSTKHDKGHNKPLVSALPPFFLLLFLKTKCLLTTFPYNLGGGSHCL